MFGRTSLLKATALALPFSLAAAAAQAASIAETLEQQKDLGTFSKALESTQLSQQLSGEGPYTVFAPTDQAFEQLPPGTLEQLMKPENRAALSKLVEHHVVEGEQVAAGDLLGKQAKFDTVAGDSLTVDGTGAMVLLVPTGLTIARIGDELVIEREGVAVSRRAIRVQDQVVRQAGEEQQPTDQQQAQGQQGAARTATAEGSDMPMTEHQQAALQSKPGQEQQQTTAEGTGDMPATEHQEEVLKGDSGQQQAQAQPSTEAQQPTTGRQQNQQQAAAQQPAQGQQSQQATRTATAEESDMPMTEHQQQVLKSEPGQEQQQTAAEGADEMPATEHQQQVLAEEEMPGQQEQSYEQARVEGKPDILREAMVITPDVQADNGVIHLIDAVLVPQEILKSLETAKQGQG